MVTKGYGFTVDDIDWSSPADLESYEKAHKMEIENFDMQMYCMGMYNKLAYEVVMAHFGAGLAGKRSNAKYINKPFLQNEIKDNGNPESQEEVAVFEMKQRINALKKKGLPESPM